MDQRQLRGGFVSLKDRIRGALAAPKREKVSVPDWGLDVWVRRLSAAERLTLEAESKSAEGDAKSKAGLAVLSYVAAVAVVGEDGAQVFDRDSEADMALIRGTDPQSLEDIARVAFRLSGMTPEAQAEAGESFAGRQD